VASSFVAGYAGYILAIDSSLKPEDVRNVIQWRALEEVLTGIRKFTNGSTFISVIKLTIPLNSA